MDPPVSPAALEPCSLVGFCFLKTKIPGFKLFIAFTATVVLHLSAAPSQPSYLSFSEVTGVSVNVSWGPPLTPNGQLEGYRVIYQPTAPVQGLYTHAHTDS